MKKRNTLVKKIAAALLASLFYTDTILLAASPILPDTKAPSDRQPLVQETASGIPLVNIAAPSAGGVSRNDYERFNVPEKGAVLNNSYTLSKTELAGFVQGNANMAGGPAKIILNQVTSGHPTTMNGFLEVAGTKADVVIANPNGITVNGGGFINTGRAILTTGKPEYSRDNQWKDIRVSNDAMIVIDGKGLNGEKADAIELYTRAAKILGQIKAETLQVTTGANVIDAKSGTVAAIEGSGVKPQVAIDAADLGAMNAGRIFFVLTEENIPAQLQSAIEAKDLVIDSKGNLYHTGIIHTKDGATIRAKDILNKGTIASGGHLSLTSEGTLTNAKTIGAEGHAEIHAGDVVNQSVIASEGHLAISSDRTITNENSRILANGDVTLAAKTWMDNQNGTIAAGGNLDVKTAELNNEQGNVTAYGNGLLSAARKLDNAEGHVAANQALNITSGEVVNTKGTLTAGQDERIETKTIQLDGKLIAGRNLTVQAEADITNEHAEDGFGITKAGGELAISTKGKLTNAKKLEADGKISLNADGINNHKDAEITGGAIRIQAKSLLNRGLMNADGEHEIYALHLENLETGRIYGNNITIDTKTLENRKDKALEEQLAEKMCVLKAKEQALDEAFAADVTAFTKDEQKTAYLSAIQQRQKEYDEAKAEVDTLRQEMAAHKSGAIAARENLAISGDTLLSSSAALLYAGGDLSIIEKDSITNRGADITALGNVTLTAPRISNENEAFSAKRVWTGETVNPTLIRIDEAGHPEKGQAFDASEFSALGSGYGAYHNKAEYKELIEEAGYDTIEQITDEERAAGKTPIPDELIGKSAPNYDYDDPIFQKFGVTSMTSSRPGYDDPKQAEWDAQYKGILETLNTKIRAYNEEAEKENNSHGVIGSYKIKNYTIIRTTTHTSEKQVQETRAGQVASGKHMTLTGNVINENSRITAGASLSATGGSIENKAEQNQVQSVTFGTTQESYTKRKPRPHKAWRRHYRRQVFMTPQKEMGNPTSLGVGNYAGHTASAPQSQDITQSIRDNVQNFLYPFHAESSTKPGTTAGKETGGSLSFLPESALYQLHPETTAKYLVETDPAFTNKKKFLSSDYMYQQMTWDPERVTKRLGDGFYEQELLRNQIIQLTGKTYLDGFTNNEDEFHALMDSGIAYAKEFHLTPGIALTKEQMAALTSDIVWLETTTVTVKGKTYDVLYPHVYLKAGSEKKIAADGSLISANQLVMEAKNQLANSGALMGNSILMQGKDIVNRGMIYGDTVQLKASHDIKESGIIHAEKQVSLTADNNITMQDTVLHEKNQDVLHTTAGIAVKGKDGVLLMEAGKDIHLTGATLEALGDNGSLILKAGNNIHLDTDTLEAKKDMTENSDNYIRTYRKTETANTLAAGKTITLAAGENLSARNTTVLSENGQITVAAKGDVTLENGYNESRDDYGLKYKERGLLSSKTTTIKSRDESKTVTASTLSGDAVQITAGGNTNMTGSQVIGTHDVAISSGKDTSISSAQEYERHDYAKQVKKSGLLSGGGLGFTIGTEKRKDQYSDADLLQKASTVGSTSGNVSIESGNKVEIGASAVLAGKDISITGENVQISSKDNVYHSVEKHEYKKSGLTVSVGGAGIEAIESVVAPATRMTEVSDHRLKALYGYETAEKIKKNGDALKAAAKGNFSPTVSIGISSSSSKSESHSTITEAQGSSLQAGQDMTIKTKEDLNVKGSDIVGNHIHLEADNDIHIWATEEKETQKSSQSSKGGSLGVSLSAGSVVSVDGKFYAGKGKENGSTTSYRASTVNANDTLTMKSGKDTDLIGSTVSGNKVKADVYGNLNIESLQTKKEYSEENISAGMSFSTAAGKTRYGGSASKGNMKSHYESVINQAGIHAGGEGFDISVKDNTDLKGGVIGSAASKDKNTLTTGTLSWEDKENKADYKAGGMGVSYSPNDKSSKLNQRGLTPNLTPTVKDNADSTTKSAVAEGTIHITNKEKQKQDIASLNRDTKNSLNQLQEIFDKTKVEEKQELVGMLEKYGNQAIHTYAESKGWKDGSTEKMLLHGAFGALMGDMAGGSAASGALSGSVNEYVMGYLTKTKGKEWVQKHPDTVQWLSAGVGAAIGNLSKDVLTGVGVSLGASKWNYLGFELSETESLLKEILIRKDGREITADELSKLYELVYQTANQGDPEGAASDSQLKAGNVIALAGVTAVLQKHYTKESVDSFLKKYHEMVNAKITDGKANNEITLRPVHVIANRNQNNFDIFLIQYSAGPVEQGYLYDKRSDKFFVTNGFTESNDLHMGLHLGGEVAGITLKTNSSSIDLNDKKTRSEILSGGSVGGTVYAGLGGGVSTPVSGEYLGKVLVFKYGVGTPQVGIGYDVAEETPEESVPISIRYLLRGK